MTVNTDWLIRSEDYSGNYLKGLTAKQFVFTASIQSKIE